MKAGRPSVYTDDIAEEICDRISKGESLRKICSADRDDFMPGRRTVLDWLEVNEQFRAKYARAREAQADHLADEMLEIADAPNATTNPETGEVEMRDPHRDRLRVATRQWIASKLAPKRYGDKLELSGHVETMDPEERAKRIAELKERLLADGS